MGFETNSNNVSMRDLWITDKQQGNLIVTLWSTSAEIFQSVEQSVLLITLIKY